MSPLTSNS